MTPKGLDYLAQTGSPKQVLDDFVRAVERREADVQAVSAQVARLADALAGMREAVAAVVPKVVSARVPAPRFAALPEPEAAAMPAAHAARPAADLAGAVQARLADWAASAVAGEDCPLPELFRSLSTLEVPPTIGAFHDCLRDLLAARRVYLHPWTGPLYAVPEPEYALLSGHNVAYYASPRR